MKSESTTSASVKIDFSGQRLNDDSWPDTLDNVISIKKIQM